MRYQVLEDNAGGMHLFFFTEDGQVILGVENIEHVQPGDLDNVTLENARTWDSQIENSQKAYGEMVGFEFGYQVVADQYGVYPDRMGRAAQRVYGIETE